MRDSLKQFSETLGNSYLFDEAQRGKRTTHWALMIPVFLLVLFGGMALGVWILRATGLVEPGASLDESSAPGWLKLTALFLPPWFFVMVWSRLYEGRPVVSIGFSRNRNARRMLKGLGIGIGMMSVIVLINWIFGGYSFDVTTQPNLSLHTGVSILLLLIAFTIQGGGEEYVLRGWLMPMIGARYNRTVAILLPALAFIALHGWPEGRPFYTSISLSLFTLLMTFWALRDGNIATVIGIHAGWNWSAGQLFGLNITNSSWGTESLLVFTPAGGVLSSGGSGGPEWSLATFVVLIASFVGLVWDIRKNGVYRPSEKQYQ